MCLPTRGSHHAIPCLATAAASAVRHVTCRRGRLNMSSHMPCCLFPTLCQPSRLSQKRVVRISCIANIIWQSDLSIVDSFYFIRAARQCTMRSLSIAVDLTQPIGERRTMLCTCPNKRPQPALQLCFHIRSWRVLATEPALARRQHNDSVCCTVAARPRLGVCCAAWGQPKMPLPIPMLGT